MSRSFANNAGFAGVVLCLALLTGCAGSNFGREEALSALYGAGATAVEASCIADTLVALDEIDALDPRLGTTDEHRDALQIANQRCVTPENLPPIEVEVASVSARQDLEAQSAPSADPVAEADEEGYDPATNTPVFTADEVAVLRDEAIERLISFGRTDENATCVVENLIAVDAIDMLISNDLGLGLDSREATAMGACLSFD